MPFEIQPSASFTVRSTAETPRFLRSPIVATHDLQVHQYGEIDPQKETFIVVMGRGQSAAYGELWARENAERYNIFIYDQPYQGASTPVPTSQDTLRYGDIEDFGHYVQHLDSVVEAVRQRMHAAGVPADRGPHLFGHSLGGYTVKRYNQLERYADRVETVHTSAHMAKIEVRPRIVRRFLGEDAQLANGLALAYNAVTGGFNLRGGYRNPVADPDRAFANRSQRPWAQTTAAEHTAAVYDVERADYRLRTDRPTIRWTNQGMLAALGLHMPWRTTYAPEFHIIPSHDVIGDPAFMRHSARTAVHGAYATVEGMLHDGLMWPAEAIRAYSLMQYLFVQNPDAMEGDQSTVVAEVRQRIAEGEENVEVTPIDDDSDRAGFGDFLRLSLPFLQFNERRRRSAEAREIEAESRERWEALQR